MRDLRYRRGQDLLEGSELWLGILGGVNLFGKVC